MPPPSPPGKFVPIYMAIFRGGGSHGSPPLNKSLTPQESFNHPQPLLSRQYSSLLLNYSPHPVFHCKGNSQLSNSNHSPAFNHWTSNHSLGSSLVSLNHSLPALTRPSSNTPQHSSLASRNHFLQHHTHFNSNTPPHNCLALLKCTQPTLTHNLTPLSA